MEDELAGLHDAFTFLLEEIDHEDLARSLTIEAARDAPPASVFTNAFAAHAFSQAQLYHVVNAVASGQLQNGSSFGGGGGDDAQWQQQHSAYAYAQLAYEQQQQQQSRVPEQQQQSRVPEQQQQSCVPEQQQQSCVPEQQQLQQQQQQIQPYGMGGEYEAAAAAAAMGRSLGRPSVESILLKHEDVVLTPLPVEISIREGMARAKDRSDRDDDDVVVVAAVTPPSSMRSDSSVNNDTEDEASGAKPREQQQQPRKPMENSTRKRQKEELAYLRDKVLELETELRSMQDRARASAVHRAKKSRTVETEGEQTEEETASSSESASPSAFSPSPSPSPFDSKSTAVALAAAPKISLWERVAKRQMIEKQKAEMKNLKLKEALEDQIKIAKSLEKVLKKRPSATLSTTQVLDSVQVLNSKRFCTLSRSEASIYDMLISNTDQVYAELEGVWAHNEYLQMDEDINDTKLMVDSSNQLYMEITHAKIIPFDLQTVIDGVWRCLSLAHVPIADGAYEAVERTDDTICAKATMTLHLRNTQALVHTRFVMKKYIEEDRIVLACESSTHSEGPSEIVHGLKCLEKGWVVIKPMTISEEGAPPSTIIQLCMRMTPTISGDVLESQRRHTGAITDLILGAFNKSLTLLYQTVENLIMESLAPPEALAPPATTPVP